MKNSLPGKWNVGLSLFCVSLVAATLIKGQVQSSDLAKSLGISFPSGTSNTVILEKDGRRYRIDTAEKSVRELNSSVETGTKDQTASPEASQIFSRNCAVCHGPNGAGIKAVGTPNFHDPGFQSSRTDAGLSSVIQNGKGGIMPPWRGKLTEAEIASLVRYVRSFSKANVPPSAASTGHAAAPTQAAEPAPKVYEPGDDLLLSLPTGRPKNGGGLWVNFTHRFAYDPAFTGTGRGEILFGLDGYAVASFGLTYGITDRISASIYRSPSVIGRPIQLMAAFNILDEHHGAPFNLTVRPSIEGQNNFRKNFTENIEAIISRSITPRAQFYVVPTASFNARRLAQSGFRSSEIPAPPGVNAFSLGAGLAFDIRPTVALVAEIIPTFVNNDELGIHRPAFGFAIQKKIYRHAFTFGFTTSPGTTVSQRAGTRAAFVGDPSADTPGGLTIGFDLMRQIR